MAKILSAEEAVSMIKDGDTVGISGFIGMGHPQELSIAVENSFLNTGHPRDLTVMFSAGMGDGTDKLGANHLGHEGLLKRIVVGHWGLIPTFQKLVFENKVEGYNLPLGTISLLFREIAGHRPGVITKIGLKTFVDPRLEGAKMNEKTRQAEDLVELIEMDGEEWLRYKSFPVNVALLNRFTTPKEVKRILEDLKSGKIDMVFGTHRLLSDDIKFKRLGLLVVDEEQRFGVTHKEKIKEFKNDVNVLTLSATPIPRTLKMALSGLRDLSIIDTPPVNRYPVQTYVVSESDLLVKDAIYKELAREGQIFVLYNRIETIEEILSRLKRLVPEARIRYAHGRMNKQELDNIMEDFVDHQFDILLSTTIIETGIDIPNANTLIIYDADYFGLSQLYQLRGRVGRSNKIAYAYLLYQKNKMYDSPLEVIARFVSQTGNFGDGCHDHSKNNQYGENYTNQMDGVFQVDRSGWFCHFSIDDFTATGTIRRIAGNLFSTGRTLDQSSHLLDSFPVLQIYFLRLLP